MAWNEGNFVTLADLYVAYRKAKVDMFYERDHQTAIAFCTYEERLAENLTVLHADLSLTEPTWNRDINFVGSYAYVPKALTPRRIALTPGTYRESLDHGFVTSDPDRAWQTLVRRTPHKADFRIVGRHPVAFHVVSALWIQKVGHLYDGALEKCAYGTRLRRRWSGGEELGLPSSTSMGTFRPYTFGFREWRANGLSAMRNALADNRSVIAVTADLRRFYHEVSPDYLLNGDYLTQFGIHLTPDQRMFTGQLIEAINVWAANTPEHKDAPNRGLPVGLSAPRVIANGVLAAFDRFAQRELSPLFYGRYVDDVLLVMDNQRGMTSDEDVWRFIVERSNGLLESRTEDGDAAYRLRLPYSPASRLRFAGEKQKVFALNGSSGMSMLNSISRTVAMRSSDWRLLPDLPDNTDELATDFVIAGHDATEEVDNLRKSDGMSIRRLAFALRLRNLEAVQRDLKPHQWEAHRNKFFDLVMDHILTAQGIFAYAPYLSRLIGLAVACRDWKAAMAVVRRLVGLYRLIGETSEHDPERLKSALQSTLNGFLEAAIKALGKDDVDEAALNAFLETFNLGESTLLPPSAKRCKELGLRLYGADLAREAFRDAWLDGEISQSRHLRNEWFIHLPDEVLNALRLNDVRAFLRATKLSRKAGLPRAVAFPTRPLNPAEIVLLDQESLGDAGRFRRWVRALRGTELAITAPSEKTGRSKPNAAFIEVTNRHMPPSPMVAVPCFNTKEESWIASIAGTPEPDPDRYFRLNKLVNDVLLVRPTIQYLVLPELAIPRRWFNRLAHKLSHSKVSLIGGLEYLHFDSPKDKPAGSATNGFVANQVYASLVTDALGYGTHVIYIQEKARAAPEEENNLRRFAGKLLLPKTPPRKPVVCHGAFHFGVVICSELTNLEFRLPFRGEIDALFVPEWNRDTNTFSSLVEASALDMHCFIVQANNRTYGDCRIRAPYREPFRRDVVRVTGGETDYFVIGKIDVPGLRAFQSNFQSPLEGTYKPVPDGFKISGLRFVRPEGQKQ